MNPEQPAVAPDEPERPSPTARPAWRRHALRVLALVVAVVAGIIVTVFTVDLGPSLRARAEKEGSKYLERPMHIGKLSAKITPGVFVVEDLVIEGLEPADRPFLKARKIEVVVPWWTVFSRKLIIESVEMSNWEMVVESWPGTPQYPNGRHNFPRFVHESKSKGPKRFTTTLRWMLASRGSFTYEDHGTPWSTAARDLRISISRGFVDTKYRGRASFADALIKIQSYEPFHAVMNSMFTIEGANLQFSRLDLVSDGARSAMTGTIDMSHWPEQTYQITSQIDFPTQKGIFFHRDKFVVSGAGEFKGTFHLFKGDGS
jgi:hypothetical protein